MCFFHILFGNDGFTLFFFRKWIGELLCSNRPKQYLTAVEWLDEEKMVKAGMDSSDRKGIP